MTTYICDTFSLSMLNRDTQAAPKEGSSWNQTIEPGTRVPVPVTLAQARSIARLSVKVVSAISRNDTVNRVANMLEIRLNAGDLSVKLQAGDLALIALCVNNEFEWWVV